MSRWIGSAGVCINKNRQVLMVLQGKPEEKKRWSVPSGGKEAGESLEECCLREINEETGYQVKVQKKLYVKEGSHQGIAYEVNYFEVTIIGGKASIQDPDQLIYEIAWKSADEIKELELSFPEDREFLLKLISAYQ